jgi:hypothetical protein
MALRDHGMMKHVLMILGICAAAASLADEPWMTITITNDHWSVAEGDPPYTVGEVTARFGEPDHVRTNEYSMDLVYVDKGIHFVCFSMESDSKINEMVASPPFKLRTADGIVLGESTAADAKMLWGKLGWHGMADDHDNWYINHQHVTFLVSRDPKFQDYPLVEEAHLPRKIGGVGLRYFNLTRLEYIPPKPVEIKADATALKEPPESIEGYLKQVFIETLDLDLDAIQDPDWNPLWENFANRPFEKQFTSMSNENWFEKRGRFEAELLARARDGKHDAASLARVFDSIRPKPDDRTAWIPVCAFRALKGGEPVWIIATKWEHAGQATPMRLKPDWKALGDDEGLLEPGEKTWSSLGHIRFEVFRVRDGELLDAIQCG